MICSLKVAAIASTGQLCRRRQPSMHRVPLMLGADWICCRTQDGCSKLTGRQAQASGHRQHRQQGHRRNTTDTMDTTETPRTPWMPSATTPWSPQKPTDNYFAHGRRSVCAFDVGVVSIHSHRRPRQWAPRCSNSRAVSGICGVSGVRAATDTSAAAICTATGLRGPAAVATAGASGAATAARSAATTVFATDGLRNGRGVRRRPCEGPSAGCACL